MRAAAALLLVVLLGGPAVAQTSSALTPRILNEVCLPFLRGGNILTAGRTALSDRFRFRIVDNRAGDPVAPMLVLRGQGGSALRLRMGNPRSCILTIPEASVETVAGAAGASLEQAGFVRVVSRAERVRWTAAQGDVIIDRNSRDTTTVTVRSPLRR
ncbi:hypothetical protein Q0812_12340 [Brevundimonas sp. 2R-24]|uniref:Uncharacterized protein n=1 Tax=Peiella sedimenti TaxID=3061083 RepID=A0ABT8SNR9_9CAUL|nr:hypothetical protein [Caulobacteraceae bacterium XZ-24]